MKRTHVVLLALLVSLSGAAPLQASSVQRLPSEEATAKSLVDAERSQRGLEPVSTRQSLAEIARRQAVAMAERGGIFHNSNLVQEVEAAGIDWETLGENVGMGGDVRIIHRAFMDSSPHRARIVGDHDLVGIGVAKDAGGKHYEAQVFVLQRSRSGPPSATPVPETTTATPAPPPTPEPQPPAPEAQNPEPEATARASEAPAGEPAAPTRRSELRTGSSEPNAVVGGKVTPVAIDVPAFMRSQVLV